MVINADRLANAPRFDRSLPLSMAGKALVRAGIDMVLGPKLRGTLARRFRAPKLKVLDQRPEMPNGYYYDRRLDQARLSRLTARQMGSFDVSATIAARRANYQAYLAALPPAFQPLFPALLAGVCPLVMPVLTQKRNEVCAKLILQGIAAVPWWAGYHRGLSWDLSMQAESNATHLKDHILALPCHQDISPAAVKHICGVLARL
jgi:hypothetical protein